MWTRMIIGASLALTVAVGAGGCLAVAVGAGAAGTVAYFSGDLEAEEPYALDVVYAAARKALEDLEVNIIEYKTAKDALAATVTARDAEDKEIKIKLESTTAGTTKISVRVGVFGNETKSRLILQQMRKNLEG
ncbi:MAG: DUF3568 family protein [Sedimentisphaerales bacterium]|nr:DUF3568 family protein [Sedimentisphaerales bacterium]